VDQLLGKKNPATGGVCSHYSSRPGQSLSATGWARANKPRAK
jgi:hypothetical protein